MGIYAYLFFKSFIFLFSRDFNSFDPKLKLYILVHTIAYIHYKFNI